MFLVVDYGFSLAATREVARCRGDALALSEVMAGVLGAKSLLAFLTFLIALVAWESISIFRTHPLLLWAGLASGICPAFSVIWYFVGLERIRLTASVDIASKSLATGAIFVVVHGRGDAWKVLGMQAAAALFSDGAMALIAYREVRFRWPTMRATRRALALGWSLFVSRGAVSLYTMGNALVLGLFAPPQVVGYYSGAEKISSAVLGLLRPVQQSMFPRMSHLAEKGRESAARLARVAIPGIAAYGAVLGLGLFIAAPLIVNIALGTSFSPAVVVLRILALLPLLQAVSNALGVQWMLPLGLDWQFNYITISAGILNLALAVALAGTHGAVGMAIAVTTAETIAMLGIFSLLHLRGMHPWSGSTLPAKGT